METPYAATMSCPPIKAKYGTAGTSTITVESTGTSDLTNAQVSIKSVTPNESTISVTGGNIGPVSCGTPNTSAALTTTATTKPGTYQVVLQLASAGELDTPVEVTVTVEVEAAKLGKPSVSATTPSGAGVGEVTITPTAPGAASDIQHYAYQGAASGTTSTTTWTPTTPGVYTFRSIAKSGSGYSDSDSSDPVAVNARYEVSFAANNSTSETKTPDVSDATNFKADGTGTAEVSYTLPTCTFTAPANQKFNGWKISGAATEAGQTLSSGAIHLTGNVTLTAQWAALSRDLTITAGNITATYPTPGTSNVTVKNNGDALTNAILKVKSVDGSTSDLKGISVTGWTNSAMANGASKTATLTTSASTPAKSSYSVVLAVLDGTTEVKTQTVTVTVNKAKLATPTATGGSAPATEGVGSVTLSTSDANHGKYQVSKSSSGPWTDYTSGTALSEAGSYYFRSVPTDTANYAESNATSAVAVNATYKVTFNANGGSGSQAAAYASTTGGSKSVSYTPPTTTTMTAPSGKPVFKGWATSASGSVQSSVSLSASTTLYAIWEAASAGGATVNVPTKSVTYNGTSTEAYSGATKSGGSWTVDNTKTKIEYYVGSAWTTTAPTNVGTYNVRVTMGDSTGAYEAQGTGTGAYKVTARPITIEKAGGETKAYGAAAITLSANNYTLSSGSTMGAGDSWDTLRASVTLSSTGNVATKLTSIGDYAITAACSNSNYTVTVSSKLNVTAKELTANAVTVTKVYDGNADITVTSGTVAGAVSGDTVTLSLGGTYNDANAGTGKTLSITTWQLAGADRAKYTLNATTNKPTTGTITAQSTTISMSNPSAAYVGVDSTLPAIKVMAGGTDVTSQFDITVTPSKGTVSESGGSYILNVPSTGSVTLTISAAPKSGVVNYAAPSNINKSVTVNNAQTNTLTVSKNKTSAQYGDTFTVTATKGNNTTGAITFPQTGTNCEKVSESGNTATYKVTNYTGSASVTVHQDGAGTIGAADKSSGNVTLSKRDLSWGTNTLKATDRAYNGQTSVALTGTLAISGVLTEDSGKVTLGTVPSSGTVNKDAGNNKTVTYTAPTLSGDKAAYYQLPAAPSLTVNITQVPVTITGTVTKTYDGNANKGSASGTLTVVGAVNSETVTVSTFAGTFDNANAEGTNKATKFTITSATFSSNNYKLSANQEVTGKINRASSPTPTLTPTHVTGAPGNTNGSITIGNYSATYTYEYQKSGDSSWTTASGSTINNLGAGTYKVRVKQDDNYSASTEATTTLNDAAQTYTIGAAPAITFTSAVFGYTRPAAKAVEFTNSGNAAQSMKFELVGTNASSFELSATTEANVAAGAKTTITIQPKAGLNVGTYTVQVKATSTSDPAATKATATSGSITFQVTKADQTTAVTGTVTAKTDTSITVQPSGGDGGNYYVRAVVKGASAPGTGSTSGWTSCTGTNPTAITGLSANTEYDVYVMRDGGANYNPARSEKIEAKTLQTTMSGTVNVTGTTKVGQPLTATKSSVNDSAATTYKWYRSDSNSNTGGTEISGVSGSTYTLTKDDLGKYIYAELQPSANFKGTITSAAKGPVTADLTVNAGNITVKAGNSSETEVTLSVGSDDISAAYNTAGGVPTATASGNAISGNPTITWDAASSSWKLRFTAAASQGTGTVTLTFPAKGSYNSVTKTLNVTCSDKQSITVTATKKQTVAYDGTAKTFNITKVEAGSTVLTAGTGYTVAYYKDGAAVASPTDAGVYNVVISPVDDSDYVAVGSQTGSEFQLTITKVDLAAKLQALVFSKEYDGDTTAPLSGLTSSKDIATGVNSESLTLSALTAAYTDKNAGTTNKSVHITSVTLTGAAAKNYKIGSVEITSGTAATVDITTGGNSTISKKAVHVDATKTNGAVEGFDKVYNGAAETDTTALSGDASLTGYLTGLVAGDDVKLVIKSGSKGSFADGGAGENKAVTVAASALKLSSDTNYTLVNSDSVKVTATIRRKTLTLTANPVDAKKDNPLDLGDYTAADALTDSGTVPASKTIFVRGLVAGDSLTVSYAFKNLQAGSTGMAGLNSAGVISTAPSNTGNASATVTATISNGNYTFATDGTTSNTKDATVNITVAEGQPNSITVKENGTAVTSITKTYGDPVLALTAEATYGADQITWTVDKTDVATISGSGENASLTFLKAGTATITASIPAGGGYAAKSVQVNVTVQQKEITLTAAMLGGMTATAQADGSRRTAPLNMPDYSLSTGVGSEKLFLRLKAGQEATFDSSDAGENKSYQVRPDQFTLVDDSGKAANYKLVGSAVTMNNGILTEADYFGVALAPKTVTVGPVIEGYADEPSSTVTVTNNSISEQTIDLKLTGANADKFKIQVDGADATSVTLGRDAHKDISVVLKSGAATGNYSATLTAKLSGKTEQDTASVSATVSMQDTYGVTLPASVTFSEVTEGYDPAPTTTARVTNTSTKEQTIDLSLDDTTYFEIQGGTSLTLAAGASQNVTLALKTGAPVGTHTAKLTAQLQGRDEKAESNISATVKKLDTFGVELSEDSLTLGPVTEGYTDAPSATITVTNKGNVNGQRINLALSGSDRSRFEIHDASGNVVSYVELDENASETLTIVLRTGASARDNAYEATLTATPVGGGDSKTATVSAKVNKKDGVFLNNALSVNVKLNATAGYAAGSVTKEIKVSYTGSKTGQVINLTLGGDNADKFAIQDGSGNTLTSVTLDGGGEQPITIVLLPGAAASDTLYNATLTAALADGGPDAQPAVANISAEVQRKTVKLAKDGWTNASVEVGKTGSFPWKLVDENDADVTDYTGTITYSVKSGSESYIAVNESTGEVTGLKPTGGYVEVTFAGDDNYKGCHESFKVSIEASALTVIMPTITKPYDGTATVKDGDKAYITANASDGVNDIPGVTVRVVAEYGAVGSEKASDVESNKPITITSWRLEGEAAGSWKLPKEKPTNWTGDIEKVTPTFSIQESGSIQLSSAKNGLTPMVAINGGRPVSVKDNYGLEGLGDGMNHVQMEYLVPAHINPDLSGCSCANDHAHTKDCALLQPEEEGIALTAECDCAARLNADGIPPASAVHEDDCELNTVGDSANCTCKYRDNLKLDEHKLPTCRVEEAWVKSGTAEATAYLNGLKVGDTIKVLIYMEVEGTNLLSVSRTAAVAVEGGVTGKVSIAPTPSVTPSEPDEVHEPYLIGFPDGTFQPQGYLNRAEAATIMSRLTEGYDPEAVYAQHYPDVWDGSWFASSIGFATDHDLITGFPDGTFLARQSITRAEFTVLVARFAGVEPLTDFDINDYMTDSNNRWFEPYIAAMIEKGFAEGYEDGSYKPLDPIKRSEAVRMMNQVLDRKPDEGKVDQMNLEDMYPDVTKSNWFYYDVMEASLEHKESEYHKLSERMVD